MNRFAHLLTLTILCMTSHALRSQDYVITQAGDSLTGNLLIITSGIFDRLEVKGGPENRTRSFGAIQVRKFSFEGNTYKPFKTVDGFRFLQLQKDGYLSLYYSHAPKATYFESPVLVLRDGRTLEVPGFGFKKIVSKFLEDCYAMKVRVESGELKRENLDQIITEFNECVNTQTRLRNAGVQQPTTVPVETLKSDPRMMALELLIARISADSQLPSQKDALDLSRDMLSKVSTGKEIPRYLIEGLKGYLQDQPTYQDDLQKVLTALQQK